MRDDNLKNALAGMQRSVKKTGYIVLMEPVLFEENEIDEEPFKEAGQKMVIRKSSWFDKLFKKYLVNVIDTEYHQKEGDLDKDIRTFIIKDDQI